MRFKPLLVSLFLLLPLAVSAEYVEGQQFQRISPPQPVEEPQAGKVEVVELFWYGCPHCNHFEPILQSWLKTKPAYIEFIRIPAVFRKNSWYVHAKAFYAAEMLGVLDKVHDALFYAIHTQHRTIATEDQLAEFFSEHGVSEQDFRNAFESFAVETKANRAMDLSKRYGIDGVPAMVVNGKYRTGGTMAGSNENMLRIVDYLAKKEAQNSQ